jgi:hypothetical protein
MFPARHAPPAAFADHPFADRPFEDPSIARTCRQASGTRAPLTGMSSAQSLSLVQMSGAVSDTRRVRRYLRR